MLGLALLVLGTTTLVATQLSYIGQCDVKVETKNDFDFDKFSTENGGKWAFVRIPSTPALSNISNLELTVTPTGKECEYRTVVTTDSRIGEKNVLTDEIVKNHGSGGITATTTDGAEFKVYFLKYVLSKYAFYYICGKDGGDKDFDYRYILSHGPLSDEDSAEITKLDEAFKFQGDLRDISIVFH